MAIEIERKFLLANDDWRTEVSATSEFRQGYLCSDPGIAVRVRCAGNKGFLTIKGATQGVSRSEFEYVIDYNEAEQMLSELCQQPLIEKQRNFITRGEHTWEIDVFSGDNKGLVIAEIELSHADECFDRPDWLGEEVSHDPRYFNSRLAAHPYSRW